MSIQFKRSSTAGLAPAISDVKQGEIVINLPDRKIYTLDNNNAVVNIGFSTTEAAATYVPITGTTMTGILRSYSTACTLANEFTPKQYVDSLIATTANTVTSTISAWKTWLPVAGGTMTGRLILNGLTPQYDNEAVSKLYVSSNYYPKTGGTLNGVIEMYASTPYIDFHYNNSSSDFTSRIIATDSSTLQLQSSTVHVSGVLTISGSLQSASLTTGSISTSSSITASGNISTSGSVTGGYIVSTGDVHANNALTSTYVFATNKIRAAMFRANSGAPNGDGATCGHAFEDNGDSGMFYEGQTNSAYGGNLVFRNDGVNAMHIASDKTVRLNTNTYYKGTLLENLMSSSKLGGLNGWGGDQTVSKSGVLYIMSSRNTTVTGYLNGHQVLLTSGRDKYGQGYCSFAMPFAAGDYVQVRGAQAIYARYY